MERHAPGVPGGDGLKQRIIEFASRASIEVTPHDGGTLADLRAMLPASTVVYVTHVPGSTVAGVVDASCGIEDLGFRSCPHIVARRIESRAALQDALARMRDRGITRALLVAGDLAAPAGPFASTLDILEDGALAAAGIDTIGVAGHPEGHKRVEPARLWESLKAKQSYAERTGSRLHVVSQFGFSPAALFDWERQFSAHGIRLPVHAGIAGPASLKVLIKYAMLCGIGASLNAIIANPGALGAARQLATSADEVLPEIVRGLAGGAAARIARPHFYSFGGVAQTVKWLADVRSGRFELDPDSGRLTFS